MLPFAPHHYINCPTPAAIGGPAQQPQEFLDPNMLHGKVFFVLAAVGALLSIVMVVRAGLWLTAITVFSALAFTFMPQHRFWNARVLPFYYLGIYLLAGVGVMLLLRAIVLVITGRWGEPNLSVSAAVLGVAAVTMWIVLGMTLRVLPGGKVLAAAPGQTESYQWLYFNSTYQGVALGWAKWNFEGLESKPGSIISVNGVDKVDVSDSKEFFGMIDEMRQVGRDDGCGRAYWEYDGDLNKYGTPMAPMLLPYFTDGCIGSMEGLYFEASSTTPFHFVVQSELSKAPSRPQRFPMVGVEPTDAPQGFKGPWPYRDFDIDQGVRHLQLLGVRYFMTYTPETRTAAEGDDRLTLVGQSGPWRVFRVADSPVVEPLENLPNRWTDVEHEIHSWARPAIEWFDDRTRWDVVNSTDGPAEWPTIRSGDAPVRRRSPAPDLRVSKVVTTDEGISFDVDEVGSPVLVKTSYFPNWEAEGADGPYRVTPNFMVVIPTSKHVTMTYGRTPLEGIAWVLTLLGVIGLFALMRWRWPAFVGAPYEFFGDRPPDDSDESWHTTIDADAVEIDGEELPSPPGFPAPDR